MSDLLDVMWRMAEEFRAVPCYLRPVVTNEDALVSAERGCPEPNCPVCGGRNHRPALTDPKGTR